MRNDLSAGGFRVRGTENPQTDQDGVNLRTLQASVPSVTSAVSDANREIRTKSLNLDSQGTATKNFSMGGQYDIAGLPDPTLEHEAVNLRTLNREIRAN